MSQKERIKEILKSMNLPSNGLGQLVEQCKREMEASANG